MRRSTRHGSAARDQQHSAGSSGGSPRPVTSLPEPLAGRGANLHRGAIALAKGAEAMSPAQIAECGQRIYDERYRKKYERRHWGKLVAINIDTGEAFVG